MKSYIYSLIILVACSGCQEKDSDTSLDDSQALDKQQLVEGESVRSNAKEDSPVANPNKEETLSSGSRNEQTTTSEVMKNARSAEIEYLFIAKDAVKNINIPEDVTPELTESDEHTIVTWPTDSVREKEGFLVLSGNYHAKVKIETKTKKILEVLVAP